MPATTVADDEVTSNQLAVDAALSTSTDNAFAAQFFNFGGTSDPDDEEEEYDAQELDLNVRNA
jgi:hypothetical protein